MNIQIFGKSKSFDTKKAERYFKERGIKFQSVDLPTKGLSKGELNSVLAAVGDIDKLIDPQASFKGKGRAGNAHKISWKHRGKDRKAS